MICAHTGQGLQTQCNLIHPIHCDLLHLCIWQILHLHYIQSNLQLKHFRYTFAVLSVLAFPGNRTHNAPLFELQEGALLMLQQHQNTSAKFLYITSGNQYGTVTCSYTSF